MIRYFKALYYSLFKTVNDDGIEHAGYMAFMVLMSFFPFIVFFLAITSAFGASNLGKELGIFFTQILPSDVLNSLSGQISYLLKSPPPNLMNLAIFGSVWTASSFVEGLRTILNKIYGVDSLPPYLSRRLMSIFQFLIITLFLCFLLILLVLIPMALKYFPELYYAIYNHSTYTYLIRQILVIISLFITILSIYYYIPNVKNKVRDLIPGTIITVFLWVISGNILSLYLNQYTSLNFIYGSLGSIIVSLLFFYLINLFFIYGAAFNAILSRKK